MMPLKQRRSFRMVCNAALMLAALSCVRISPAVNSAEPPDRSLKIPRELQSRFLVRRLPEAAAAELSTALSSLYDGQLPADDRLKSADQLRALLPDLPLDDLRSAVRRRVDLIAASVRAGQIASLTAEDRAALETLVAAANRIEETCSATDADTVRSTWLQLRHNAAVMSVVRPVFMKHYFNHNVHITLSEHMLTRFVSDYRTEHGTIAECILGAWVTGSQVTNATVSADIKRSAKHGHFLLRLNGQTSSNTRGRRKPATIFTRGSHTFLINAPIFFNGEALSIGTAEIDVNTRNQTVGVKTDYDGFPLLGPLARSVARKKAREKRSQSEDIAARKIANRALPEFVKEANERFLEANASIQQKLFAGLNRKGVGPDSISSRSSESHLAVSSRIMGTARLSGTAQPFAPLPARGIAIQLHETAINNVIDGLEFGGRSIHEDALMDELNKSLSDLLQREISLGSGDSAAAPAKDDRAPETGAESPTVFVFDRDNPVRVRIEQDTIVLVLQIGIEEVDKDPLPRHRIEVPISIGISGTDIVMSPPAKLTNIRITALERVPPFRRAAIANQIRRIVSARLPERKLEGQISIAASDTKTIDLQTIAVSGRDGWLYVELQ